MSLEFFKDVLMFIRHDERRPILVHTRTTQRVDEAETQLVKAIKKLLDSFAGKSPLLIQRTVGEQIYSIVQSYAEEAYFAGKDYAERALGRNTPLTQYDLMKIRSITDDFMKQFWERLHQIPGTKMESDNPFLDALPAIQSIIAQMMTKAVNIATKLTLQTNSPLPSFDISGTIQSPQERIIVEFVTRRDSSVCIYCEPLDGQRYDLDDPNLPDPPIHFNCRCRQLAVIGDRLFVG